MNHHSATNDEAAFALMIKKTLVGFLATVGAIALVALLGYFVLRALPTGEEHLITQVLPSPNGAYKAVLLSYVGGWGLSINSYCYDKVLVLPSSADEGQALLTPNPSRPGESKYEIYSAACDTFRDHTNSPKLVWTADYDLEILFSINSTALFSRAVRLRKLDDSKRVNVRYIVEYDPIPPR